MLKKLTVAGLVAATASSVILLASPAGAGIETDGTNGTDGVLAGNQIIVPVSIPVNVCGDAIAIVGRSWATCRGGSMIGAGQHHHGYHHPWDS